MLNSYLQKNFHTLSFVDSIYFILTIGRGLIRKKNTLINSLKRNLYVILLFYTE